MFAPSIFFSHGSPGFHNHSTFPDFHTSFWSSWSFHTSFLVFSRENQCAGLATRPKRQTGNVQATVGRHFLFHEQIPIAANGSGYLRVATKSLWWQHEHFPKVWTSEGLTTCMENGYQWNINSTTWNHLRMMWQAQPL